MLEDVCAENNQHLFDYRIRRRQAGFLSGDDLVSSAARRPSGLILDDYPVGQRMARTHTRVRVIRYRKDDRNGHSFPTRNVS
jgi:hypothetical protein